MKVLVIITTKFVSFGGLTTVMMNYYRHMNLEGLQIDFASENEIEPELRKELTEKGSIYSRLPNRKNLFYYQMKLFQLCKKYDVLHVNGNSSTMLLELLPAKLAGVTVRIAHNHTSQSNHPFINGLLHSMFLKSYTVPIACSNAAGDWLFGKGKYFILNNAVDTKKYAFSDRVRNQYRRKLNLEDHFIVGNVAKFDDVKNHQYLLEIFKQLLRFRPDAILVLAGDGPLFADIRKKSEELDLSRNILFLGMRDDVSSLIQAFDVFVFPSKWEGMPLSLLEVQASGLQCFASDTITHDANVTGLVHFLPINCDVSIWAEKISQVEKYDRNYNSIRARKIMGERMYDITKTADILRNIYLSGDIS